LAVIATTGGDPEEASMHEEDDLAAASRSARFGVNPVLNRSGGHNHTKDLLAYRRFRY
jgi:hypothetical protein